MLIFLLLWLLFSVIYIAYLRDKVGRFQSESEAFKDVLTDTLKRWHKERAERIKK